MTKELECPNCGPGLKLIFKSDGNGVCGVCGGTFTPGPEPKLIAVGEFDEMKGRIAKLESDNAELQTLLGKQNDATAENEPVKRDETPADQDDEDV